MSRLHPVLACERGSDNIIQQMQLPYECSTLQPCIGFPEAPRHPGGGVCEQRWGDSRGVLAHIQPVLACERGESQQKVDPRRGGRGAATPKVLRHYASRRRAPRVWRPKFDAQSLTKTIGAKSLAPLRLPQPRAAHPAAARRGLVIPRVAIGVAHRDEQQSARIRCTYSK